MDQSFKQRVYEITKQIPRGKVATYGQIATMLGDKTAARAVGLALSQNTDPENIPCHRVVAANGNLTGYAFGGVKKKKEILEKEGVVFSGEVVNLKFSQWHQEFENLTLLPNFE
jgi:methylated-DNA-protein-cysteine methyltransferase related protein